MFIVVFIVTFVMSIYGVFAYSQMKSKHYIQLNEEMQTSINQLKDSIQPYIESYAPEEYLNLIENEMKHANILAIVVKDYPLGRILGQDSFVSGKIRDSSWALVDFDAQNKMLLEQLEKANFKRSIDIFSKNTDEKIAFLTVYGTDKFLNKELHMLVAENVLVTMLIYILLISGIYYGINLFMIEPIKEIVEDIQQTDKDGIPLDKLQEIGSKEIVALSSSMNNMIDTVKDSRRRLQEQKEEFETIFNNSKDGIAILDLETNFLQCNQSYLDITGFTKEEILKLSCLELTLKEDIEKAEKALADTMEFGNVANIEKRCLVKDNKVITVNMSLSLLPDKTRILVTIKDVTQLKIMEAQAKLASMGEMIGNIAHQWRQPLSIISTSASGAKIEKELGVLEDEQFNKHMDSIVEQTEYLSNTIDDFRNFIKDGSKKTKPIHIVELLEKALVLVESSFKNNYIELVKNFEVDEEIIGHGNELVQAFINILNNAKDAIKENLDEHGTKVIFIETKKVKKGIAIIIKDNAGGIPLEIKERIFEPYFTTKHQSVGTGIGLSLARSIFTDHHNATIDFTNEEYEYNGENFTGACFKITFIKNTDS